MTPPPPRSIGFPLRCAAAYAGGVVGYQPLLTLLLPLQVARIAGEQRYGVLAMVAIVGSFAAGGGNILFGWLSDRSVRGGRRRWIAGGLAATIASFALVPAARTVPALMLAIAAFQLAINAVLAPMMALIAEEVPERQIGLTTGLFAAGAPLAAVLAFAFVVPPFAYEGGRLTLVALVMVACFVPLLRSTPRSVADAAAARASPAMAWRDLAIAWGSRLLLQVAGNAVFLDLLYLMAGPLDQGSDGVAVARTGTLVLFATLAPLPVAVVLGRWSDQRRRRPVLVALAAVAALGLSMMALLPEWGTRAAGFLLFSIAWNAFLTLQVGYIFRLLPDPGHRGRDLGLVNLANTVPTLIGQTLIALIASPQHPETLLLILAAMTFAGGALMLAVRGGAFERPA